MNRRIFLLLLVIATSTCLFAQTSNNPFSKFGYKKQVMYTSSKGEFEEFHGMEDVVEIGSVFFNAKSNTVVGYINKTDIEEVASATSAMSVDPLCEKYYWISPYAYCMNNPVKYVDPDGRDGMVTGTGTQDDPYVITAKYFYQNGSLSSDQINGLNSGIEAYNNSGGKNGLKVKNEDGSVSFVKYNLCAQEVDDVQEARLGTAFETSSGETMYYGNAVGTTPNSGSELGKANNFEINFNVDNINEAVSNGMSSSSLNKGVAIHEIGHNLGGEHSDGTSVMQGAITIINTSTIGGTTTSYSYPSMSNKFSRIVFGRRDTPRQDAGAGRLWTKKP